MIVILIENHYHYTISLAMLLWYLILHSHLQNQRPQILRISLEKGNIKLLWKVFDSRKISMFSSDISIDIDAGIRCFTSNINIDIFFKWTPLPRTASHSIDGPQRRHTALPYRLINFANLPKFN